MRIGIDVDDTITDTYEKVIEIIAEYYNKDIDELKRKKYPYDHFWISGEYPDFDNKVNEFFDILIPTFKIKGNAVNVINKLKSEGHCIIIITARRNNKAGVTHEFLDKNGIPYDKIYEKIRDKGEIAKLENIDIFIDDSIEHCKEVEERGIRAILFDADFNRDNIDYERVKTWNEIYELIKNIELGKRK